MPKRIKVMVVDDSEPFASAVAQFLSASETFEVLENARSGSEALARAHERPDLMFIDLGMPGLNGLAVASLVKAGESAPKVVIMTLEDSEERRDSAIAAGADAFLPKGNFAAELHAVVDRLFGAPRELEPRTRTCRG